ncbi:MAG: hypothetical protein CSA22_03485 [Deltaproteobacteria bacterium]|nr:MAG: hypothetical protein CSA22_03485 [Deltaproteobacteria bacterium]
MLSILIEVIFISACFKVLKESKEQLKYNIETRDPVSICGRQALHIALLVIYLYIKHPQFPVVLLTFIVFNGVTLLWLLIDKDTFLASYDKMPPFADKLFPVAYILYFGFHLLAPFIGFVCC